MKIKSNNFLSILEKNNKPWILKLAQFKLKMINCNMIKKMKLKTFLNLINLKYKTKAKIIYILSRQKMWSIPTHKIMYA